ncbi:MAG TPA: MFS transporter, partial [Stellaceae bacterium]|nr:MFS transporter [Stellaceae bacterium]
MATQSTFGLLRLTGFRALFLAQLLGAFNDNVLKVLVSLLAIETAALGHSAGYLSLVSAVFMAPYLLFSGYAGYVADICNKRRVLIAVKAGEVAIMVLAFAAL